MTDIPLNIVVGDAGVPELEAALQALGLSGSEAALRIENGWENASSSGATLAAQAKILAAAMDAGVTPTLAFNNALGRLTSSELAAAGSTRGLQAALASLGAEAEVSAVGLEAAGAAIATVGTEVKGALSAFGGATAAFGALLGVGELAKAADEYNNLSKQLKAASSSQADFQQALTNVNAVADQTGGDIESIAKIYATFKATIKDTSVTADDLKTAVTGLVQGLNNSGASTQQASRAIHDLAEAMATGELKGQQLASILRQTPLFAHQLGEAMGVDLFGALEKTNVALEGQRQHLQDLENKQAGVSTNVGGLTSAYKSQTAELSKLQSQLTTLQPGSKNYESQLIKNTSAQAKLTAEIGNTSSRLSQARGIEDEKINNDIRMTKETINASEAEAKLTSSAILDGLKKLANGTIGVTAETASFGRIATIASNNVVELYEGTNDVTIAMTALKFVLLEVARNAGTIVEVITAVAGGFAAFKIVTFTTSVLTATEAVGAFGTALRTVLTLFGLFSSAGVGLIIIGLTAIIAHFIDFQEIIKQLTPLVTFFGNVFNEALQEISRDLGLSSDYFKNFGTTSEQVTQAVIYGLKFIITGVALVVEALLKLTDYAIQIGSAFKSGFQDASTAITNVIDTIQKFNTDVVTGFNNAVAGVQSFVGALTGPLVNALNNAIDLAKELLGLKSATGGAGGSGGPVGDGAPGARNGASFMVPGGTGVDSRILRVSPGEHVTVQTQAQRAAGVVSLAGPRRGGFAAGGVFPGTYTGGGSIANDNGPATSVTGFVPTGLGQQQTDAVTAVNDNTTATVANTAALSGNDGVTQALSSLPTAISGSVVSATSASSTSSGGSTAPAIQNNANGAGSFLQGISSGSSNFDANGNPLQSTNVSGSNVNTTITSGSHAGTATKTGFTDQNGFHPDGYIVDDPGGGTHYEPATYRDGGDMYMHGGTGVDSKLMTMAVSPGESVHVRTPSQRAAWSGGGNNTSNTFVINTPNAKSFGLSQSQIQANMARSARRAARRIAGK